MPWVPTIWTSVMRLDSSINRSYQILDWISPPLVGLSSSASTTATSEGRWPGVDMFVVSHWIDRCIKARSFVSNFGRECLVPRLRAAHANQNLLGIVMGHRYVGQNLESQAIDVKSHEDTLKCCSGRSCIDSNRGISGHRRRTGRAPRHCQNLP